MNSSTLGAVVNAFSALGTVGAFAVGMLLLRREHRREEVRGEEESRAQAVRISAWLEGHRTPQGGRELRFHVHNASDMPIYEVSLANPVPDQSAPDQGTPREHDDEAEFIGVVPPGQTIERTAPKGWTASYSAPEPVEIEFLDSRGRRWRRDEQGALEPDDARSR